MTLYDERAIQEVIARARAKGDGYMGPCSDCKYRRGSGIHEICAHPVVVLQAFTMNDDYDSRAIQRTAEQRDVCSLHGKPLCGPKGTLFKPSRRARIWKWIVERFQS